MTKATIKSIDTLIEEHSTQELIDILIAADDEYTNSSSGELTLTDEQYDTLRRKLELVVPHHVYFTGVGSTVRGGKVKLPHQMGSLNQLFENEVETWVANNKLSTSLFIITDKLDGVSAMTVYDGDGDFQIAYSRGNGIEGADISRHIRHIVPTHIPTSSTCAIRGEVIISKSNFTQHIQPNFMSRSGTPYKNARNCIAGILNSSSVPDWVYQHIDYIAYEHITS